MPKKKQNTKSTVDSWDVCKIVQQIDENEYDEIPVSESDDDETDFDDEISSEDETESEDGSELTYFVDENNLVLIEIDGDADDSLEDIYNEIQNYGEDAEDE